MEKSESQIFNGDEQMTLLYKLNKHLLGRNAA
jgi:hypothetical protein